MSEKIYTPLPPRSGYFKSDPRAKLTPSEQEMYDDVLAHFTPEDYALPNLEKGELTDQEKFWLSRECLLRYLRASKWKVASAITRLEATLEWRRGYGMYDILNAEILEPEAVTGKAILFGFDVKGRPGFYMIPSRQNTEDPVRQNQFAVWMLERCIDLMEPGVETVDLLINFAQRAKHPNMSQARQFLNIIQDHYPERLGLALVLNVPFLVNLFFKVIMPFVDPITREKVKFNPSVVNDGIFDKDMVMSEWWDGSRDFEYVHEKYWPELVKSTQENATNWTKKWVELGAKIGISEWEYKGGSKEAEKEDGEDDEGTDKTKEVISVIPVLEEKETKPVLPLVVVDEAIDAPANATTADDHSQQAKKGAHDESTTSQSAGHHAIVGAGASSGGEASAGDSGAGDSGGDAGGE